MAFFNYSTMQMTAKIVYYGPGLGGKTTNLEYIHHHTTDDSRGEMVSLQTQTDRTLFFDLLPMEVGTIAGFRTRIQLYTVPGQVFYNTTRKLVLKGVDGVVFVADSQRPMLQANQESLHNLEQNLATLGLSTASTPLVLQYNKQDLDEICTMEELDRSLNQGTWPSVPASALYGKGIFETLQSITRLTLLSLKRQLESSSGAGLPTFAASPLAPRMAAPPRREEESAPVAPAVEPQLAAAAEQAAWPGNGRSGSAPDLSVRLGRPELARSRRLLIDLRFQDEKDELVHEVRDLEWELATESRLEELLLRLSISPRAEE
jgi:signal recognition particle receptor subunit beta